MPNAETIAAVVVQYVAILLFLAMCNNGLIEYLVVPIFRRLQADEQPILYISYGTALVICYAFGVNALVALFPPAAGRPLAEWIGLALTAVPVARGSNWIADNWGPFATGKAPLTGPTSVLQ